MKKEKRKKANSSVDYDVFLDYKKRVDQKLHEKLLICLKIYADQHPENVTKDKKIIKLPPEKVVNPKTGKKELFSMTYVDSKTGTVCDCFLGRELKEVFEQRKLVLEGKKTSLMWSENDWASILDFFAFNDLRSEREVVAYKKELESDNCFEKTCKTISQVISGYDKGYVALDEKGRIIEVAKTINYVPSFSFKFTDFEQNKVRTLCFNSGLKFLATQNRKFKSGGKTIFDWNKKKWEKLEEMVDFQSPNFVEFSFPEKMSFWIDDYIKQFPQSADENKRLVALTGGRIFETYDQKTGCPVLVDLESALEIIVREKRFYLRTKKLRNSLTVEDLNDIEKKVCLEKFERERKNHEKNSQSL